MTDEELNALARDAYQAYGRVTGNKNYQGLLMPQWLDLTPTIRMAWVAAAEAARAAGFAEAQAAATKGNE